MAGYANEIRFTILEDGVVSVNTPGGFAPEEHLEAEQLLKKVFADLGGENKIISYKPHSHGGPSHSHLSGHVHA